MGVLACSPRAEPGFCPPRQASLRPLPWLGLVPGTLLAQLSLCLPQSVLFFFHFFVSPSLWPYSCSLCLLIITPCLCLLLLSVSHRFCFFFEFLNFILFIYFLYSRFFLVIYFIHISVYMSIPISQFIPPPPPRCFSSFCVSDSCSLPPLSVSLPLCLSGLSTSRPPTSLRPRVF